ncbi:MAG: hypothetical protein ABWZ15_07400 [Acidimicrobiia bacterium]
MRIELPIDHVAFGTRDLDRAIEIVKGSGLSMTPIGEAQWPGDNGANSARTVSIVVADRYLDIIEYDGAEGDLAPTGVVLQATDIDAMRSDLMQAGVRCGRPYIIVRRFFGAGPDQHYTVFGTDTRHACGLPQSVVTTDPGSPMRNTAAHTCDVVSLEDGARRLGVDLSS